MKKQSIPLTPRSQSYLNNNNQDKVSVLLRIRPLFQSQDPQHIIQPIDQSTISINKTGIPQCMKFNHVQYQRPTQQQIYSCVEEAVNSILQGIDSTIFAYGQTGAGKTYTIIGDCPEAENFANYHSCLINQNRGILPRALDVIIKQARKRKDTRITISFYQIYNEKIYDLLSSNVKALDIRQNRGQITIPGLLGLQIIDYKQALNLVAEGIKNRVTGSTVGNVKSSRSHSIFHIKCERLKYNSFTKEHQVIISNLRVVDLAGSQKFNIPYDLSQAQKQIKISELKHINGSLSKLGHCISALTNQSRTHIPFRDSKLTRILRQSLIGSSKIRLIICVSPSISSMNQTISTLQFADRVKKAIFERPNSFHSAEKKKTVDFQDYQALVQELQKQRKMRKQYQRVLKSSHKLGEIEIMRQNDKLRQQITLLKEQIKVFTNQNKFSLDINRSKSKQPSLKDHKNISPNKSPTLSAKNSNNLKIKRTFTIKQGDEYSTKSSFYEINQQI